MSGPTDQDLEDLAVKMAREAVDKRRGQVPDELLEVIESRVLSNLIATPEGRLRLRRCLDDPAVDKSDQRSTDGEPLPDQAAIKDDKT